MLRIKLGAYLPPPGVEVGAPNIATFQILWCTETGK